MRQFVNFRVEEPEEEEVDYIPQFGGSPERKARMLEIRRQNAVRGKRYATPNMLLNGFGNMNVSVGGFR